MSSTEPVNQDSSLCWTLSFMLGGGFRKGEVHLVVGGNVDYVWGLTVSLAQGIRTETFDLVSLRLARYIDRLCEARRKDKVTVISAFSDRSNPIPYPMLYEAVEHGCLTSLTCVSQAAGSPGITHYAWIKTPENACGFSLIRKHVRFKEGSF